MSTSNPNPTLNPTPITGVGDIFTALSAPFTDAEVRTRRGPNGRDLRYITARTVRHRLDSAVGPANWECRVEPAERWVKSVITLTLPDGRTVTREALSGYPDNVPNGADRVKSADSIAFKRAAALFGVGSYLYGDALPPPTAGPAPVKSSAGHQRRDALTVSPDQVPATAPDVDSGHAGVETGDPPIRFTTPREFYHWAKSQGVLCHVEAYGNEHDLPIRILRWSIEEIDAATQAVMERVSGHTR